MKARTWPEGCYPTAEQWLDWLLANDRGDQLLIAVRVLDVLDIALQCVACDHAGHLESAARERWLTRIERERQAGLRYVAAAADRVRREIGLERAS
ncbi:hypothetical protein [Nocardioides speluncae]|uniref:hypothetical protein n=1 Tax=Nocardioides speluncae TaxID=2670337 RepID=UPI000D6948C5|nr:hypothetical protein [Nocardioides speluncae]